MIKHCLCFDVHFVESSGGHCSYYSFMGTFQKNVNFYSHLGDVNHHNFDETSTFESIVRRHFCLLPIYTANVMLLFVEFEWMIQNWLVLELIVSNVLVLMKYLVGMMLMLNLMLCFDNVWLTSLWFLIATVNLLLSCKWSW